jgi:glutamine synthetase
MAGPVELSPSPASPRQVKKRELSELAASLSDAQLKEAQEVFTLFDKDGKSAASPTAKQPAKTPYSSTIPNL